MSRLLLAACALLLLASAQPTAKQLYDEAMAAEARLRDSEELLADRGAWTRVADRYQAVVRNWPRSGYCDDALWRRGVLLREAAARFDRRELAVAAIDAFTLLADGYPASKWAPAAQLERARIEMQAAPAAPAPTPSLRTVLNVRHWVGDSHTRVVIDLDGMAPHAEGRLSAPDRVFLDFHGARLSEELATRVFPIEGSHLTRIRVANRDPDTVRVVLDFSSITHTNIFVLPDPYRVVVDSEGERPATIVADRAPEGAPLTPEPTEDGYPIAQQLGARVHRIVLDAGHGGKDPGTRSGSLLEKDIALDVTRRLRDLLEKDGFEVVMTREDDRFIPLEKRAFIANDGYADLFISIHANAARNRNARGLETYYLNFATSPDAAAVAARENASHGGVPMAQVQEILKKMFNNHRIDQSSALAHAVQDAMVAEMLESPDHAQNRGVKTAGFHVLLGADAPAILLELGFVSNRDEARLLHQSGYRDRLAAAIARGVRAYARTLGQQVPTTAERPEPG